MIHHLREAIPRQVCQEILALLAKANFVDGLTTVQAVDQSIKNNLQLPVQSPGAQDIAKRISKWLTEHKAFQEACFAKSMIPPRISKYGEGMYYDAHLDAASMRNLRTDISATICLNDSSDYDGGELVIQEENGEYVFKGGQGDIILYPASYIHEVKTVTRGERIVALSWIESKFRNPQQRRILQEMMEVLNEVGDGDKLERPQRLKLKRCQGQLIRMWMDS